MNLPKLFVNFLEAVDYLIDLMNDPNTEIRRVCDACIDIIKVGLSLLHLVMLVV